MPKKLVVIEQLRDYERWKKRHGYGKRSMWWSRRYLPSRGRSEYITSVRWENIVNELPMKASVS